MKNNEVFKTEVINKDIMMVAHLMSNFCYNLSNFKSEIYDENLRYFVNRAKELQEEWDKKFVAYLDREKIIDSF